MKLFRCRIQERSADGGSVEALLNLNHVVFLLPHPERPDCTMAKIHTGEVEGWTLLILAPIADVREEMERQEAE
jgi:hypothetical protein